MRRYSKKTKNTFSTCTRMTCVALILGLSLVLPQAGAETIYASYRKDFFYPYNQYREVNLPDPINGGRFHLVSISSVSGTPGQVTLNGKAVTFESGQNPDDWFVDWMLVYPTTLVKGEPVWVSFHTRASEFDKISSAPFELKTTDKQTAMTGTFTVSTTMCNITYVASTFDYEQLLIHVHNGYTATRTIKQVIVNGTDVTSSVVNKLSLVVPPMSSTMLTVPVNSSLGPGHLYTVVLMYVEADSVPSVAGGRLAKTHFPIESWPKSHECPYPTIMDDNYKWHRDHGIDTLLTGQSTKSCGSSTPGSVIAGQLAPKYNFYVLAQPNIPLKDIKNTSNVLAIFLSDESDTHLNDGLRTLMAATTNVWKADPSLLTYGGGSRSRRSGLFAGVTDIQGMDMYIAACAPHIQEWLHPPPPRGSYDYLRLTRNNHMPLPTWTYSQLLNDGWNAKIGDRVIAHREPNPDEARIQAMSVIAACAKGLMYFQSEVSKNQYYPKTWTKIGNFNKDIGAVREYLREGDCTDMISSSDGSGFDADSIVQAIRSSEAIIVTIINVHNHGGYSDAACEIGRNVHWLIWDHTIAMVSTTIPTDFGKVVDMFEVKNGTIYNMTSQVSFTEIELGENLLGEAITGDQITFSKVKLSSELSTRLFVLANSLQVRKNIQSNL